MVAKAKRRRVLPDYEVKELMQLFKIFDKDNDGRISYSEFRKGFSHLPKREMDKSWEELSAPGQGYINED